VIWHLIVGGSEPTFLVLVIQYLDFKRKISPHVLYDHNQKWQLHGQNFLRVSGTCYVVGAHVGTHYFQNARLYVLISTSFDVPILH
jgi:hypothetical protein